MINRRDFLKSAGVATAAMSLSCASVQAPPVSKKKPNNVFILADDLGCHDLSCCGSELYQTPNIDRLAMEGIYFNNAHAPFPTCAPSRMSIVTGKYPARLGCWNHGVLGGVDAGELALPTETFLNINFPKLNGNRFGKYKFTFPGKRVYNDIIVEKTDPRGLNYYWIAGDATWKTVEGSDFDAISKGYVSISPLKVNFADLDQLERIKRLKLKI